MSESDQPITPRRAPAPDMRLVELEDRAELEFWLKVFNTTHHELRAAVADVGPYAGAVAQHLKKSG